MYIKLPFYRPVCHQNAKINNINDSKKSSLSSVTILWRNLWITFHNLEFTVLQNIFDST